MVEVSVICTVRDEEESINDLIDSLMSQSRSPDEIVIVDGGSKDATVKIIRDAIAKGNPIKIIEAPGANIAQGRNIAIRNARYDIIASTDAGCRLENIWLESLMEPFESDPSVDVVAGSYRYEGQTPFEKAMASVTGGGAHMREGFLPSSRSIAFRKSAWTTVGGYPEGLRYAEDTAFDIMMRDAGLKFVNAPKALVAWRMRPSPRLAFKQFFNYNRWDVIAKNPSVANATFLTICLVVGFVALALITVLSPMIGVSMGMIIALYYFSRYGILMYHRSGRPSDLWQGPIAAIVLLLGITVGTLTGHIDKHLLT